MSAASSLSVELWQKILRHAISISDFLDPSSFEGVLSDFELTNSQYDRNNETAYWRAERYRNAFQRVCKSWDSYLRSFEHRFVRIVDVWHSIIPSSALKMAIRIYFDKARCGCDLYLDPQFGCGIQPHYIPWASVTLDRLEIVDMSTNQYTHGALTSLSHCAKHIKMILARDNRHKWRNFAYSMQVVKQFPELRIFYGQYPSSADNVGSNDVQDTIRSNVETLSMIKYRKFLGRFSWEFPNLRYLRIDNACFGSLTPFTEELYPLLSTIGGNLETLYLNSLSEHGIFPPEVWEWCPKLEKLATTLDLVLPPLISHPLHTFIATPDTIASLNNRAEFLDWPNIRTIMVDWIWNNTLTENHIPAWWRRKLTDNCIRIEDRNGLTWKECVELASRVSSRDGEGRILIAVQQNRSCRSRLFDGPFYRR